MSVLTLLLAAALAGRPGAHGEQARVLTWRDQQVSVVAGRAVAGGPRGDGARRAYRFSRLPADGDRSERLVTETAGQPYLRTGNTLFDGLFAMAIADAQLDRVPQIRDEAFNGGRSMQCVCFETGERWHYVWTRDISYSVDLGLAALDPQRSLNSLLFKTSGVRAGLLGEGLKPATLVAQDTGSGGSWPVSTDRVVWILAAYDVLQYLPAAERRANARRLLQTARDTVDQDRRLVFDAFAGLYRGETSFLDWREQNYPEWTRNDVSSIAGGYALSTNVLQVIALQTTARLALESGLGDAVAGRYRRWADELRGRINAKFWREDAGLYASYLSPEPNSVAANSYDLLGLSLAIIHGIADEHQARAILQHYPISAAGPPVLWPERSDVAIYHNRAIWPFVTAYALRAAKIARHADLGSELVESLLRGSAVSLSNMENFEFLTQQVRFEDGAASGPVINSPRQLWSVAGYVSMVFDTLWGLKVEDGQLSVNPWLPARLAASWFAGRRDISLRGFRVGGVSVNVTLQLPADLQPDGWLEPQGMWFNGARVNGSVSLRGLQPGGNELRVTLRQAAATDQASARMPITRIPFVDSGLLTAAQRRAVFAPRSPVLLQATGGDDEVALTWQGGERGATAQVYGNGQLLAAGLGGDHYEERSNRVRGLVCYSVTQRYADTGLTSPASEEACIADPAQIRMAVADHALTSAGGSAATLTADGEVSYYAQWGAPSQVLTSTFTAKSSGWHRFDLEYANALGPINTGITAAVKTVTVRCGSEAEQSGGVVMPHRGEVKWGYSTGFLFKARAAERCEARVADGFNMTYLAHFALYTGGRGGASGPLNGADIAAARVEFVGAVRQRHDLEPPFSGSR